MTDIGRIAQELEQDSRNLSVVDQEIVGPLEPGVCQSERAQRTEHGKTDHQAQTFELASATINAQCETVVEVLGIGTDPAAPPPSSPLGLTLRHNREWRNLSSRKAPHDLRIRRVQRVEHTMRPGRTGLVQ
ncbi:hypothetical protein FQZ97_938400 [compost metagenome]